MPDRSSHAGRYGRDYECARSPQADSVGEAENSISGGGRVETVLDAAGTAGLHPCGHPAAWRGHLGKLSPARSVCLAAIMPQSRSTRGLSGEAPRGDQHIGIGAGVHDSDGRHARAKCLPIVVAEAPRGPTRRVRSQQSGEARNRLPKPTAKPTNTSPAVTTR